jgi:hypothetical protein
MDGPAGTRTLASKLLLILSGCTPHKSTKAHDDLLWAEYIGQEAGLMVERAYDWFLGQTLLIFSGLAFGLCLASETGLRLGRSRARRNATREGVGTITAGMLGLLSFTLGLTIGYAQDTAEARRGLVVQEADAISTVWLQTRLVERNRLLGAIHWTLRHSAHRWPVAAPLSR